jgi:hypothetical protein
MGVKLVYEERHHRPWLLFIPSYFKVYEDRIEAYFWPYKHVTPISEIEEIKIVERIPWYVGWGLRIDPFKKKIYFAIHHGRSVEIKRRNGYWKSIILSVKNPEEFASIIKKYQNNQGKMRQQDFFKE